MSRFSVFVFTLISVLAIIAVTLPEGTRASPSMEEAVNVAEAIRYLEQLDKYYSHIARPRFGRSIGSQRKASGANTLRTNKPVLEKERR